MEGKESIHMLTLAAFLYSFQASAFMAMTSAAALALVSMASASASPFIATASEAPSASLKVFLLVASAMTSNLCFSASAGFLTLESSSICFLDTSCSDTSINFMRSIISVVIISSLILCRTLASCNL